MNLVKYKIIKFYSLKIKSYGIIIMYKGSDYMSPLAKEVIEKLSNEEDSQVLAEVLDFYEYLKQKKQNKLKRQWDLIVEDEPDDEEIKLIEEYKKIR